MANEEEQKTTQETTSGAAPNTENGVSIVQEAKAIRDEILKAKEELKAENDRKEKIQANELLGGQTAGAPQQEAPKEVSDGDYAAQALAGEVATE